MIPVLNLSALSKVLIRCDVALLSPSSPSVPRERRRNSYIRLFKTFQETLEGYINASASVEKHTHQFRASISRGNDQRGVTTMFDRVYFSASRKKH